MSLVLFRYSERYLTTQIRGSSSKDRNSNLLHSLPGLVVFNKSVTINITLSSETFMSFVVKTWTVWQRWPDNMAISITIFNDNNFKGKVPAGCKVFKCSRTVFTSHTSLYFGRAGLVVNFPLRNRETSGWLPKDWLPCNTMTLANALLAVFNAL